MTRARRWLLRASAVALGLALVPLTGLKPGPDRTGTPVRTATARAETGSGVVAPAAEGGDATSRWTALRQALSEALLGDGSIEPLPTGDLLLLVALEPRMAPGRVAGDTVDFDVVRRYPGAAAYYLWRAAGRAAEQGLAWRRLLLAFPGEPRVVAEAAEGPGARAAGDGFDPSVAAGAIRVYVDGAPFNPDPATWPRAADALALQGDAWLGRYRPRSSLGSSPDVTSLLRARRLYEAALDLYPAHARAMAQLGQVEDRLEAASLFSRASTIIEQNERLLREADRRHDDLAAQRYSFYLWRATDLLQQSLRLDKGLLGASAALDRLSRLLGDRPRPPYETAAQLEAELKEAYQQQARELDYPQARMAGEALRGLRVHLTGQVVRRLEDSSGPAAGAGGRLRALLVSLGSGTEASSSESAALVYVQLPEGVAPELTGVGQVGQSVEVWGELAGNYRYRDPVGRFLVVVRVVAAYLQESPSKAR